MPDEVIQHKDITPVQKLDAALNLLAKIDEGHIHKSSLMLADIIQLGELDMVFNKLIKDGFSEKRQSSRADEANKPWDKNYTITFDGQLFHQKGGYAEQFRKDEYNKWLEDKLMKTTIDSNVSAHSINRLFWITLIVAIAGAIAPWLDFAKNKEIDALKEQIEVLQSQSQQKKQLQFSKPAN